MQLKVKRKLLICKKQITLVFICSDVSVRNIAEFSSDADILLWAPCRAGKKHEWMRAGLWSPRRGATSRVILKNGSYYDKLLYLTGFIFFILKYEKFPNLWAEYTNLVDGTRNQNWDVTASVEDERKATGKAGSCFNRRKVNFTNGIWKSSTEMNL